MTHPEALPKDSTGNPAPLGLLGFGMTTVLLNLHNVGFFPADTMILGMGIFYGGIAQVIAGIMEWKKGNTFGATAFTSYGLFWLSLVAILVFPKIGFGTAPTTAAMGWYLLLWGILTLFFYFGTFTLSHSLQFVFASLTLLFVLLALSDFTGNVTMHTTAGVVGIVCGSSAIYVAVATVLNEMYGKVMLPLWPVKKG
jgi:uncharacterized protein